MKAKLGTARRFYWFDLNGAVTNPAQVNAKIYSGATLVKTFSTLTQHGTFPDLYYSEAASLITTDPYTLIIYENTTALDSVPIEAGAALSPEAEYNTAAEIKLSTALYNAGASITAYYISPTGVVSVAKTAGKVTAKAAYVVNSPITLDAVGPWLVVWVDGGQARYVQEYWVDNYIGLEVVKVIARLNIMEDSTKHVGATVVASLADGTQLGQAVTDSFGAAFFSLYPGEVIFSIIKAGSVFTNNNFTCQVLSSAVSGSSNIFPLITDVFGPTTTTPAEPPNMCEVYATLFEFSGVPLRYADIFFSVLSYPQLASGAGIVGTSLVAKTDVNGKATVKLVQGTKVEVAIPAASLRRVVTIPASVGPVNLLTLISGSSDVFDAISLTLPAAPRRTL